MARRTQTISRLALKSLVDPHIFEQLSRDKYSISWCNPKTLLTPTRLDLAFRLFYLSQRSSYPDLASAAYKEDIRAQSLGAFRDPHNHNKEDYLDFKHSFDALAQSIKSQSYDSSQGFVPLAHDGTILNGSHRVACSIYLGNDVACLHTELDPYIINDQFYSRRGVDDALIAASIREYLEYSTNSYIACLWPSSRSIHTQALDLIPNKIATRTLNANLPSALSILHLCYRGMEWIGNLSNNFSGVYSKLYETFPVFSNFKVIAFTANCLDEVITIKHSIRSLTNLEFSSVHITDTPAEAISLSRVLFNPSHYDLLRRLDDCTSYTSVQHIANLLDSPHPIESKHSSDSPPVTSPKDLSSTVSIGYKTILCDSFIASPIVLRANIVFRTQAPTLYSAFIKRLRLLAAAITYRGCVTKHSIHTRLLATLKRLSLYNIVKHVLK